MRQIADTIDFIDSKLNSDVDLEKLPKGDAPVDPTSQDSGRRNVYMKKNNYGVISLMEGNTQIAYSLPGGTNKIVGSCEYIKENALLIFLYNSGNNHRLIQIDYDNTVTTILEYSLFNFQSDRFVEAVMINDEVYFTDGYNEPGMIDLGSPSLLSGTVLDNTVRHAKDAPITPPSLVLVSDTDFSGNNIYNKAYQFIVKYIYWNGQETIWSDATDLFFCNDHESINGVYNTKLTDYNKITLSYSNIPNATNRLVEKIAIGYRYYDIETGAISLWYLYDIVTNESPYTSFSYDFYDNKPKMVVIDADYIQYNNPQKSDHIALLGKNRILLSGVTVDYDNIDLDMALEYVYGSMLKAYRSTLYSATTITAGSNVDRNIVDGISIPYTVIITIINVTTEEFYTVFINVGDETLDYSYFFINSVAESDVGSDVVVTRNSTNNVKITNNYGSSIVVYMEVIDFIYKYNTVKAGTYQYLGIEYSDGKGRRSYIQADDSTQVYVPYHSEVAAVTEDILCFGIKFTINHEPPSWATRWRFVRGESNISSHFQLPVVCSFTDDGGQTADVSFDGQFIKIDINAADDRILAANTNYSTLIKFDPEQGDRVRFKAKTAYDNYYTANYKTSYIWDSFTNYIDLEIKEVDTNGDILIEAPVSNSEIDDILGDGSYHILIIEIYRLRKDVDAENLVYTHLGKELTM